MRAESLLSIDGAAATASSNGAVLSIAGSKTRVSFVATLTGATTPVVSVILQVSNDVVEKSSDVVRWDTLRAITGTVTASFTEDGSLASPAIDVSHRWVRARFVYTSGTGGTVSVRIHTQGWA